ncbi:DUF4292 domain-containing protein [Spirosoma sp.]|uniref:DUF4292 domain-containing protein n=1 Tax=Spirosoma sp. TaxID=1899569 RepID=UPI003B3A5E2E
MKKQRIFLTVLSIIPVLTYAQTAAEILDKNIAALGGAPKIAAIKTLQYDQVMRVMGTTMPGKVSVIVGQAYRNDMSLSVGKVTQVISGDKGWATSIRQGVSVPKKLTDTQVNMLKGNVNMLGADLATVKQNNYPVSLVGKENLNGKEVFTLKVMRPEGEANYYVDATTYLLSGMKTYVSNQDESDEVKVNLKGEMKMIYSDYQTFEGLKFPTSLSLDSPGIPDTVSLRISNVVFNPTLTSSLFKMPN